MQNEIFYHTLANGIKVVFRRTNSPVAYVGIMVGAGTRDEQKGESGIAHFIEHCSFKGTKHRTAKQIINRIEGVGGEINAFTTKEETTFYAAVPTRYVARATDVLADMVFNSVFPTEEIDKEKQVVLDEIESYNDSPSELIFDDFENLIFSGNPLQNPILGTRRSVNSLSQKKNTAFVKREYATDRMVYFVQGSLKQQQIIACAEKFLAYSPLIQSATTKRIVPDTYTKSEVAYHKHTHQTHVMLGARAYPIGDKKQISLYLLNQILGGGSLNSKLNLSLREDEGLVYGVESIYSPMSDTGYWAVYLASEPQHIDQCLSIVYKQLEAFRTKPLSSGTLYAWIRQIKGNLAIAAENQENNAIAMAKNMLYLNYAPSWQEQWQALSEINSTDLLNVANEMFDPQKISLLKYC